MKTKRGFLAKQLYLRNGKTIDNAVVTLLDAPWAIKSVRRKRFYESTKDFHDLGDVMLLPGFLNAHCHLEYSTFKAKLNGQGTFGDWIKQIVQLKMNTPEEEMTTGAKKGLNEIICSGTTSLYDNLAHDITIPLLEESPIDFELFFETFEFMPEKAQEAFQLLINRIENPHVKRIIEPDHQDNLIAPHAPYSVSPDLFQLCIKLSADLKQRLKETDPYHYFSIHVSETWEEVEFFEKGSGPICDMKKQFGSLPASWETPGISPVAYLNDIGALDLQPLIIHCGCLRDGDVEILKKKKCTVVFCPGIHRYFDRGEYPLMAFLKAKIPVQLGTDSLASNDSLNIVNEAKIAHEMFPDLTAHELIQLMMWKQDKDKPFDRYSLVNFTAWDWHYKDLMEWIEDDQRKWSCSLVGENKIMPDGEGHIIRKNFGLNLRGRNGGF